MMKLFDIDDALARFTSSGMSFNLKKEWISCVAKAGVGMSLFELGNSSMLI